MYLHPLALLAVLGTALAAVAHEVGLLAEAVEGLVSDWHPCTCGHLGVEHAANGPCVAQQELCTCVEFVAVVRS